MVSNSEQQLLKTDVSEQIFLQNYAMQSAANVGLLSCLQVNACRFSL